MSEAAAFRARILLADDHPVVCQGLKEVLAPAHDVVAMVHHGLDVVEAVARHRPDIVLLDLGLPGKSGAEVLRELKARFPALPVLMVSMHAERVFAEESVRAGAQGYVVKSATGEELREAVRTALAGGTWVSEALRRTDRHRGEVTREVQEAGIALQTLSQLTDRQREVLTLVGKGLRPAEVAAALGLTEKGVDYHRAAIRRTLGLADNTALLRFAILHATGPVEGRG